MAFYVSARAQTKIITTSLHDILPSKASKWNGNPVYFILYTYGKEPAPLNFSIDVEGPDNWDRAMIEIALTGKYVHDRLNVLTPHYSNFLKQFPDWAQLTAWLGTYELWIY